MSRDAITMIQTGLRDLGYAPGEIDGLWGSRTKSAMEGLIRAKGQPVPVLSLIRQGAGQVLVHEIIVHCSATRPDWMEDEPIQSKRAEIRRWHLAKGWADIGYHWLIDRDGKVLAGRAETVIGAHVEGHNAGTIGICLIGGHGSAADDRFDQHYTPAQDVTLRQIISSISTRTQIRTISGHNQYAPKACPGFYVPSWYKAVK